MRKIIDSLKMIELLKDKNITSLKTACEERKNKLLDLEAEHNEFYKIFFSTDEEISISVLRCFDIFSNDFAHIDINKTIDFVHHLIHGCLLDDDVYFLNPQTNNIGGGIPCFIKETRLTDELKPLSYDEMLLECKKLYKELEVSINDYRDLEKEFEKN